VPQLEAVLAVVSILANYGRHLAKTLERRAAGRGFATIARFFGTVMFDTILAHLHRVLGFFIGEEPVDPFAVVEAPGAGVATVATGPP